MNVIHRGLMGAALLSGLTLGGPVERTQANDEDISFRKRAREEKRFVAAVGEAIVKAAHGTARKIALLKYDYSHPKPNRTELTLKMEYSGAVTGKRYVADIVLKIDSSDKEAWEVLNIEYADTNAGIKHNEKKVQELIKQLNK
jgi:hypothetical protein